MCLKFTSSVRGVPDRVVVQRGGKVVFVELKTQRGRLSLPQELCIKRLRKLGARAEVLRSLDEVMAFLDSCDA
jgi:hypothetical protein